VDVALSIPPGTATDGAIGTRTIPAGRYAVGHFEIEPDKYSTIWDMMVGQWLPESGYQFDEGPCFELYRSGPDDHPGGKHLVDLYIPVKPL
jgi:AraC family transcriptional regulator